MNVTCFSLWRQALVLVLIGALLSFVFPMRAHAAVSAGDVAKIVAITGLTTIAVTAMLNAGKAPGSGNLICGKSQCGQLKKQPCAAVDCYEMANNIPTWGKCVTSTPPVCGAKKYAGIDGKATGVGGMGDFMGKVFGTVLTELLKQALMPKPPTGGAGGVPPPGGFGQQYPACVVNPATGTVSPIPCMDPQTGATNYGSGTTGFSGTQSLGSGVGDQLLSALGENTNTNTNVSETLLRVTDKSGDTSTTTDATITQAQLELALQKEGLSAEQAKQTAEALLQGDISIGDTGATIYVRSRDPGGNTEVAGFYGGSTFGARQSQSLIGRLCSSRPWSGGFMSFVIAPSFFDGLCQRGGYQVGTLVISSSGPGSGRSPTITITQPKIGASGTTTVTVQPSADIWADPSNVRLGTRTYIFWDSRDVASCAVTGPSFEQDSLSGGAATVPISDPVTFSIECTAADGRKVTDSVRVNLAL